MEEPEEYAKLPSDMYDESMGDTEEEEVEEISMDVRQARHFLEEVKWDPEKMEDWQWDLLYRYVPSPERSEDESDRSFTTENVRDTVRKFDKKRDRNESVDEDNPIVEIKEGENAADKYPDIFTMYALVKMNVLKDKRQQHPPKTFGHRKYDEDDEDEGDGADEMSDEAESKPPSRKSSTGEEDDDDKRKPAKERRKLKKKKRRTERRRLREEALQKKIDQTPEVTDVETPVNNISYLQREYVFLNQEDLKKIDEVYAGNCLKYYSPHKRERTTKIPDNIVLADEEPPIKVAPSLKDLIDENLAKLNRTYYLHRVIYLFAYRTKEKIGDSNIEAPMTLKGYIAEQNTSYSVEYFISGCLFFYRGLAIVMVEGGENEMMRHFLEMRGSPMLGEFLHGRVLYVSGHVVKRYFQHFVACTAEGTGPVEKIEKTKITEIIKSFNRKMTKLYKKLPKIGGVFKPGCVVTLPESVAKALPSFEEMKFLLKLKVLRKLPAFVNQFIEVPRVSDSSDEAWPPQDYEIPYNILDPGENKLQDLEKEMLEKVRKMKEKYKEMTRKRIVEERNRRRLFKEMMAKIRSAAEQEKTKKGKKVSFKKEVPIRKQPVRKTKKGKTAKEENSKEEPTEETKSAKQINSKEEPTEETKSAKEEKPKGRALKPKVKVAIIKDITVKNEKPTNEETSTVGEPILKVHKRPSNVSKKKKDKPTKQGKGKHSKAKTAKEATKAKKKQTEKLDLPKMNTDSEWVTDESAVE